MAYCKFKKQFMKPKFKSIPINGFPSKLESSVYDWLLLQEKAGLISDIKRQDCVELSDAKITWKVDFSAIENGKRVYIEAKGVETEGYRLKKKLWKFYGPGKLYVYKGTYKKLVLAEIIEPRS